MWMLILFQENIKMKVPYIPSPSLSQIGSNMYTKNGYKILKFHI